MYPSTSNICGSRSTSFLPGTLAVGITRAPGKNSERSRFQSRFLSPGPEMTSYAAAMIASIDSTSRGSGSDFDIGCSVLGVRRFLHNFQNFHRCVVARNPAYSAATQSARTAEKHVVVFSFDAPTTDLIFPLSKWESRRVVKDVAMIHSQCVLDIDGTFAFDTGSPIARYSEASFDRLFQPLIDAGQISFLRFAPHIVIISCEQAPRRIQSEKRHRVKALFT